MPLSKRFSVLRDPVHGDIYLTHEELAVLDTRAMQRLRGIKQLGMTHLVYPGAVHTRFDHSIGSVHMAARMIEAIQRNAEMTPRECLGVGEEEARIIRLAALVHDVTHIPFGHNVEDQTGLFRRHDSAYRFQRALDEKGELGRVLERFGVRRDVVNTLLASEGEEEAGRDVPPYWSQILADTISCDILDYLQRDAYFTGLNISVDPRVVNYFRIERKSGNLYIDLTKRELLREDILSEVVRLLEARYYFSERVYYHHAKVAAGALMARAVELASYADLVKEEDFYDQTDASVVDLLERRAERADTVTKNRIRHLTGCLRARRLPKRVCVFPRYANVEVQEELVERTFSPGAHTERVAIEERVRDLVRFSTGREVEFLVYCPSAHMQLKEAQTHVQWPGERDIKPLSDYSASVPRLADLERSYRDLWKFYCFADATDTDLLRKIQEIAVAEFPGAKNVYRIEEAPRLGT